MRKAAWILTPLLILGPVACGDDGKTTTEGASDGTQGTTGTGTGTTDGTTTTGTATETTTENPTTTTTVTATATTTTTTTTTDATTDMTTGTSSTTGNEKLSCEEYCAIYDMACADFAEYDNNEACLDQCSQWPVGTIDDTAGDTLGCRLYHVGVANTVDANMHCPHASPNGAGVCVAADAPTCQDYCTTYAANCTADLYLYKDEADCLDQCSHFWPGTAADTAGDSVGCRLYHAGVAMTDDVTHCPHAGPSGGGVCAIQ